MSRENVVADSWEDADADPVKELMEKVEKVKLLQRKEEKKEAFFEKVKAEENSNFTPKLQEDGLGPVVDEPKRVFLRRPKDGFAAESVVETSPQSVSSSENKTSPRSRPQHKPNQKEPKQPAQTYEERQAAYQAARNRILGTEYKPDNQEIKEIKFIDRSKSPETLKMTQQNMVEHYGEELSRELMHQSADAVVTPEMHFLPDFSQPPPGMMLQNGSGGFNGQPGFQPPFQNYPQLHQQQQQFIENSYYMQMGGQVPVQYNNHGQMQQFLPHESPAVSSSTQGFVEDPSFYYYPPSQHQINYAQNNLPNMSYPPPNIQHQPQQNQNMNHQMQQQNAPPMNHIPMQNVNNRTNNHSMRGGSVGQGANRQQMMYPINNGPSTKPPPLMSQLTPNRGGGYGQRQYQQQQMGNMTQNPTQNNINNGRKQMNKNGKNGRGNDNCAYKNNFDPSQPTVPGQNPIPFGCPPRHATAIREQHANAMPPNTGDGLLGAHPMMSQWPSLPNQSHQ